MNINLRSVVMASAMVAVAALTVQPSAAWAARSANTLHVPFQFEIAGQVYPAGDYRVHLGNLDNTVALEGNSHTFIWIVGPGDANPTDQRTILTFDVVGARHLLHSVQYRAMTTIQLDKKALKDLKETIPTPEESVVGE